MRRIFLDTETTGLDPARGDRIVEIAAIAYENRHPIPREQGGSFHHYLNPEREVGESIKIHGIEDSFLLDKPRFAEVAEQFIEFVRDAEIVIHNAKFDVDFLDSELKRLQQPKVDDVAAKVTCSLEAFKKLNVSTRHSLNAMCEFYGIDHTERDIHSATLDTELLAKAYLRMIAQQSTFVMDDNRPPVEKARGRAVRVVQASAEEIAAHNAMLAAMQKKTNTPPLFLVQQQNAADNNDS